MQSAASLIWWLFFTINSGFASSRSAEENRSLRSPDDASFKKMLSTIGDTSGDNQPHRRNKRSLPSSIEMTLKDMKETDGALAGDVCNYTEYIKKSPVYLSDETTYGDYLMNYKTLVDSHLTYRNKTLKQDRSLFTAICFSTHYYLQCNETTSKCDCANTGVWKTLRYKQRNGTCKIRGRCDPEINKELFNGKMCYKTRLCVDIDEKYNEGQKIYKCIKKKEVEAKAKAKKLKKKSNGRRNLPGPLWTLVSSGVIILLHQLAASYS